MNILIHIVYETDIYLNFPKTKRNTIPIKNNIPPTIIPTKTKTKAAPNKLPSVVGS